MNCNTLSFETANEVGNAAITLEANKVKTDIIVTVEEGPSEENLTMEEIGLPFGHFNGIKPQGDGGISTELDLYDD